ncbi:conserved hypothetical protein [Mycolicibacter sinensis]|uniref:Uncharacterized protein n=1 Tax=Mycolicibacter sinensis (strain JDM601) TaxID=875328 RepID=F5Z2L6_MYCSD|nr:hypothetical protein [Mycolicibacter sinensis]AEF34628.1 conserved hypothetical protein [Mycolicibacter sinensis]
MNALVTRARTALRSGAGPVAASVFVVGLAGSTGWAITIAVLAALAFAGYVAAPWLEEQRGTAARRREAIRERADRQHRWALRGDNRGFYGAEGAELMRRIADEPDPGEIGDPADVAAVAYTADGLTTLLAERPACWRYAVFVSVLVQRYAVLQPRLRDQQLGYAPPKDARRYSGFALGQYLFGLLEQMSALLRQIEDLMLSPAFRRMFGDPTDERSADADAIMHAAHRLMDLHERLLELAESCRSTNTPVEYADVVRDCARVFDVPLEGYRRFIDEFVGRVAELRDVLPYARGTIEMDPVLLEMDDNDELLDKAFAAISRLVPGAR